MIRPPSAVRHYDAFFSGDPAFVQLADNATDEQRVEHARLWEVARETGNLGELLIPGSKPTKFVMRPLPGSLMRKITDRYMSDRMGAAEVNALALRCALVSIENLGDIQVKHALEADYG